MKKLKLFFACLLMAVLSIGQVWADNAAVGATLWAENFAHFGTNTPSTAGTGSGTTIFGGATITYAQSSTNTKGYNETLAGGTAPELLLAKSNTTWTISGIPTGGATEMALSFKSNKTTFAVTTSTADLSISGSAKAWTITVDEGKDTPATFDLVIKNTGSSNARIDDVALTVVTAAEGGGTPIPTLSVSPAVIDFGTVEQNAVVANKTVIVSFENLTGSVAYSGLSGAFSASGTISATGDEITIAANTATAGDYSQTLTVQSAADELSKTVTVKMKVVAPLTPIAGGVVDELIVSDFGVTSGSYTAFTDKQASNEGHSDAVYAGKVARNGNSTQYNIQMNTIGTSTAAGREIATSTSGGYAKRVQAIWATQSTNTANRKLTVYGSESAYTGSETVATGTNLGDLTYTAGDAYAYLDIDGDYPYIQIVASGAIYMDQINVTWVSSAAAVAKPAISGTENFLTSTEVSITCATEGATIYYTTNGSDPKESGSVYSGSFSLTESAHVQAIAKLGGDWSSYADKQFTKITPLTVAEAIAAIPNKDDVVNDQYVSGIVCTEAPSLLSGGKLTYYISADGSETNKLQIYKGKNLNNTEFSSVSDLAIGDRVVVFGQLKNYNGTPEMNDGNYLVSKTAPAVAAPTFSPDGGGFMGETDVTISCVTASSAIYYTLDGSAPSKLSTLYESAIHLTATTTINAIAFVGDDPSLIVSKTFTLTAPMTVAEALAALDSEDPINNVAVAGIISTAPTSNPSSGKLTYFISDDGSASDELEVYKGFGIGGASFSDKTDLQVGDEVTVFGNLTIYNTTKEFAEGSRLIAFNRPQVDVESINLTESTAEVEEGKTVTLHASVVPANATNKTIVWSVQSGNTYASVDENGVVTGIAAGEAVIRAASDEDATIFAECTVTVTEPAPLSPWASVYTSNVTLSTEGGTSASAAKVKFYGEEGDGYDAIKAGTGSAQGAVVVNVPAGATALHFHAYGWNSESVGLTVTAPTGVTVSPATEISINSNSGIASNSPFTLAEGSDPKTDAYYAVSLSGNTEATNITISATSGKRFVLFGVNQEGGVLPELQSIAISGDLDNKSYKAGQALDMAGLTVTATYQLGEETPYNVDITNDPGLSWTYDPLVENQDEVTVTAHFGDPEKTASKTIEGLTVTSADPKIYVEPSLTVNFGSVEVGEAVPANKTITVTLTNVAAATATPGGTNPEAFSIDKTALVDGDVITISVIASTAAAASYSATITITDNAAAATEKVVNLSFAVTEPAVEETPVSTTSKWVLATAIEDDMEVLITGVKSDVTYAISEQGGNNRTTAAGTLNEGVFTPGDNTMSFTLVAQDGGKYALQTSNGKYLYAASSSGNHLKTRDAIGDDGKAVWTISINGDNEASIVANCETTNWRNVMQFNQNGTNAPVVACYASASQSPIKLYVPKPVTPPTPVYETVREGLIAGNYYTICYPKAMTDIQGATLWSFVGKDANFAYIEQETATTIEAGKPYIMYATASTVTAVLGDETNAPGANGAIHGTFSDLTQDQLNTYATVAGNDLYLVIGNELRRATGEGTGSNTLPAQRAFVVLGDIPAAPAHMPAHVRRMPMQTDQAQGFENIEASEKPMKLMIDGQMYILRGEKVYDATGRLVK